MVKTYLETHKFDEVQRLFTLEFPDRAKSMPPHPWTKMTSDSGSFERLTPHSSKPAIGQKGRKRHAPKSTIMHRQG